MARQAEPARASANGLTLSQEPGAFHPAATTLDRLTHASGNGRLRLPAPSGQTSLHAVFQEPAALVGEFIFFFQKEKEKN